MDNALSCDAAHSVHEEATKIRRGRIFRWRCVLLSASLRFALRSLFAMRFAMPSECGAVVGDGLGHTS